MGNLNYVSTHQDGPDEILVILCLPGATQLPGTIPPHPIPEPFRLSVYVLSTFLTRELRACARASYRYHVGNGIRSLDWSIPVNFF